MTLYLKCISGHMVSTWEGVPHNCKIVTAFTKLKVWWWVPSGVRHKDILKVNHGPTWLCHTYFDRRVGRQHMLPKHRQLCLPRMVQTEEHNQNQQETALKAWNPIVFTVNLQFWDLISRMNKIRLSISLAASKVANLLFPDCPYQLLIQ
jgi:hypothetical protein